MHNHWGDAFQYAPIGQIVTCAKCGFQQERNLAYCAPDQPWQDWQLSEKKLCEVKEEHFHSWCERCQYRWITPLVPEPSPAPEEAATD